MDKKYKCFFQQWRASIKKDAYGFIGRLFPLAFLTVGILISCSEPSSGSKSGGDKVPPTINLVKIDNATSDKLVITFSENVTIAGDAPFGFTILGTPPPRNN
ncbi:MAG: hypothetical protein LBI40_03415 [Treponema sp.]|jgi:hypothetical protein|nr:hypothetical protein [Treponema sp.]